LISDIRYVVKKTRVEGLNEGEIEKSKLTKRKGADEHFYTSVHTPNFMPYYMSSLRVAWAVLLAVTTVTGVQGCPFVYSRVSEYVYVFSSNYLPCSQI